MVKLNKIFNVEYGNQLDFNKMIELKEWNDDAVNFVSRTSNNLGVTSIVKRLPDIIPYQSGLITIALGGAILSSYVQPRRFYTAQNIMVLKPINDMSFNEKIYYCLCIQKNAFKYSTFGREANRTLKNIELPSNVPKWVYDLKYPKNIIDNLLKKLH